MGNIFSGVGLLHRPADESQILVGNDGAAGWLRPSVIFTVEDSHMASFTRLAVDRLGPSVDTLRREIRNVERELLHPHGSPALAHLPTDSGYSRPLEIPLDRPSGRVVLRPDDHSVECLPWMCLPRTARGVLPAGNSRSGRPPKPEVWPHG